MQRRLNPYTPGAGRRPAKLAGRDADLENFQLMLTRLADGRYERSMIFSGLSLPVALVGAGLPTLPMMLRGAKPYAPRLFTYHDLGRLSDASSRAVLLGPAGTEQVEFAIKAVSLITQQPGGYPYFLQEYGRVLWDEVPDSPIVDPSHDRAR